MAKQRGRPRRRKPPLSDEVVAELLRYASTGANDKMLAEAAGVAPSTWSTWKGRAEKGFREFFEKIDNARAKGDIALLAVVRRAAVKDGDWKAARYLLACRHREFSERHAHQQQVQVEHSGGPDIMAILREAATHAPRVLSVENGQTLGMPEPDAD